MRKIALASALVLSAGWAWACGDSSSLAYGDFTSIIAVMEPTVWEQVDEEVYDALEPTIRTVRDEKTFTVTYQDPAEEHWGNLRRFRQLLLVGTGNEPWMQEALALARRTVSGPGIYHAYDVWARGQQVTMVLAEPGAQADAVRAHLEEINRTLDEQYRGYVHNRMFLSGVDSALADTLARTARFQILLPEVYRRGEVDSTYVFRNDNPSPGELIRQITVSWRSPIPEGFEREDILAWREEVVSRSADAQDVKLDDADAGPFEFNGHPAYQIQATWVNPPELDWPAAGPFITRAIICPQQDRMYLLDAWLYAPGKEKYEYMVQLQWILDSFRCGPA